MSEKIDKDKEGRGGGDADWDFQIGCVSHAIWEQVKEIQGAWPWARVHPIFPGMSWSWPWHLPQLNWNCAQGDLMYIYGGKENQVQS